MDRWEKKIAAFLHDPPTKPLDVRRHKAVASRLLEVWNLTRSEEEAKADTEAAAADRPGVPGYEEGCSIDFSAEPEITHPLSQARLRLVLERFDTAEIEEQVLQALKDFQPLGDNPNKAKFLFVSHGLMEQLSRSWGPFRAVWPRIPADTRIPDHSIWNHNNLVSALAACGKEPQFLVFALGPVQSFIAEARKLRDLWIGSILLSYLSWVGMKAVAEDIGPDHILYPSLNGQPLMAQWLMCNGVHVEFGERVAEEGVASFPNRFVALVHRRDVYDVAERANNAIRDCWDTITESVFGELSFAFESHPHAKEVWRRQLTDLWEINWAAAPWLESLSGEWASEVPSAEKQVVERLGDRFKRSSGYPGNRGRYYSPSHALSQRLMAAVKTSRQFGKNLEEPGYKCTLCGRREQLGLGVEDRAGTSTAWQKVRAKFGESEFGEHERLCAVCLVKRLMTRQEKSDGIPDDLLLLFKQGRKFPSTTEMAFRPIRNRLERQGNHIVWNQFVKDAGGEDAGYGLLHEQEDGEQSETVKRFYRQLQEVAKIRPTATLGKYYAVLVMDGDKMGDLVNGKSPRLASWRDIMHSSLPEKMTGSPATERTGPWLDELDGQSPLDEQRHLTPAVHKTISEALGDFSLCSVPRIVREHKGRLIYAGGDDLLAIMPIDTVLQAASEINHWYQQPFAVLRDDDTLNELNGAYSPQAGERLLCHLGKAATISAAVLFVHHKEPLRGVLSRAQALLKDVAKKKAGRDAIAICLIKRGGGERVFHSHWFEEGRDIIADLLTLRSALAAEGGGESSRLMYKIHESRDAIAVLTATKEHAPRRLVAFLASLIEKGERDKTRYRNKEDAWEEEKRKRAAAIANLLEIDPRTGQIDTDALLIARFLAQGGE
ncbi:MAG: type III-B CRISPR-associated protein Cas10/Cmr2 [Syntrophobacteria bacterium]